MDINYLGINVYIWHFGNDSYIIEKLLNLFMNNNESAMILLLIFTIEFHSNTFLSMLIAVK